MKSDFTIKPQPSCKLLIGLGQRDLMLYYRMFYCLILIGVVGGMEVYPMTLTSLVLGAGNSSKWEWFRAVGRKIG